jgi:hypothetical protein
MRDVDTTAGTACPSGGALRSGRSEMRGRRPSANLYLVDALIACGRKSKGPPPAATKCAMHGTANLKPF